MLTDMREEAHVHRQEAHTHAREEARGRVPTDEEHVFTDDACSQNAHRRGACSLLA